MTLIALTGYATSGKDAFADALGAQYGYVKMGFADAICSLAIVINPRLYIGRLRWWKLSKIVSRYGWTEAKKFPAVRRYLQLLGSEGGRACLGEDCWVDALMPRVIKLMRAGENVVITNVRFANEAQAILDLGGDIIRIIRNGVGQVNEHNSDKGEAFQYAIEDVYNNGTLSDLAREAARIHGSINAGTPNNRGRWEAVDANLAIRRYNAVIERAIQRGIHLVMEVAAPEDADLESYALRHECTADLDMEEDTLAYAVKIDGEDAGVVSYEEGVVSVDIFLAR